MARNYSPCLECKQRALGCHSKCTQYSEYKRLLNAEQEEQRHKKNKESATKDYIIQHRIQRKRRR